MVRSLYLVGYILFNVFFRLLGFRVEELENVPKRGAVIIAPNHVSYWDPPLAGSALHRPLFYMAKKELFAKPVLAQVLKSVGAFEVARSRADIGAFRKALDLLKNGNAILMFPEGARGRRSHMRHSRSGIGLVAAYSQAPVVPCFIYNSDRISKFARPIVRFGKPVKFERGSSRSGGKFLKFGNEILDMIKEMDCEGMYTLGSFGKR